MIRFCDGEVYTVYKEDLKRQELLSFFLNGHLEDIVAVYLKDGAFYGILDYYDVLENEDIWTAIRTDQLVLDETVFEKAKILFEKEGMKGRHKRAPVLNREGELDCFCYDDCRDYSVIFNILEICLRIPENPSLLRVIDKDLSHLCIIGMNELTYKLYQVALHHLIPVLLRGERWKLLSEQPIANTGGGIKESCILYVYAEEEADEDVDFNPSHSGTEIKNYQDFKNEFKNIGRKIGADVLKDALSQFNGKVSVYLCDFSKKSSQNTFREDKLLLKNKLGQKLENGHSFSI